MLPRTDVRGPQSMHMYGSESESYSGYACMSQLLQMCVGVQSSASHPSLSSSLTAPVSAKVLTYIMCVCVCVCVCVRARARVRACYLLVPFMQS